jgi:hypothetical protein
MLKLRLKLKLNYDRQSVGQSVLVSGTHMGPVTNFSFSFKFSLDICYFVAPSLIRRRVCNLLLLLVLARAVPLGSESRRTKDHILLSQFLRLPKPGGPGPRIYIPQEQGGSEYPWVLGSFFVNNCDSQDYGGGILTRLHTGKDNPCRCRSRNHITTDSQSASLGVSPHPGPAINSYS